MDVEQKGAHESTLTLDSLFVVIPDPTSTMYSIFALNLLPFRLEA